MARITRIFSDLDLNFTPHPVTGDLVQKFDENAVKQSLKNLLQIRHFEKPWHSEIGSPLRELLFENITPVTERMAQRAIIDVISNFEPRVNIIDVNVIASPENNSLYINLVFKIINTERPITLDFILERTR
jgi:phage baseplate assembly protein W